jgi:hypothetical protein
MAPARSLTMGRMKKRRRLLIVIVLVFLAILGGGAFMVIRFAGELGQVQEKDAAIFGDNTLSEISQDWSPDRLDFYASVELLTDHQDEDRKVKMAKLQKELGAYKSGDGIVSNLRVEKDAGGDDALVGDYLVHAKFAKGNADVEMKLIKRKIGDWQIKTFTVVQTHEKEK